MSDRPVCACTTWLSGAGLLILRLVVGVVFVSHGWGKLLNPGGVVDMVAGLGAPLPEVTAWLVISAEFFAGLGLIVGLLTRVAGFGIFFNMMVAVLAVHWKNGFFAPHGIEYPLTLAAAGATLMLTGAGPFSVDGILLMWWRGRRQSAPAQA